MGKKRIVCFGPGPQFKGGIANYNTSQAKAFAKLGHEVHIVSWTQQYPAIIPRDFIDRSSKSDQLAGTNIQVTYVTNYNNPISWRKTVQVIKDLKPDMVVIQWAIALQGLPLGYIAGQLRKLPNVEVVFEIHVVKQKETSALDKTLAHHCLSKGHTYIAHAYNDANQLKELMPEFSFEVNETGQRATDKDKTIVKLYHPVYDMFQPDPNFDKERVKQEMGLNKHVFLFFGFIRKYKGLHNLIKAFAKVAEQRDDVSLLVAGESFWQTLDETKMSTKVKNAIFGTAKKIFLRKSDDERNYKPLELIKEYGLEDKTVVVNEFIPNEDVHKYFQVSDCLVNYYHTSNPSGVESIAYNFRTPVLATKVGHFPESIREGFNGYLAEAEDVDSMAATMIRFIENPIDRNNVAQVADSISWENYARVIAGE